MATLRPVAGAAPEPATAPICVNAAPTHLERAAPSALLAVSWPFVPVGTSGGERMEEGAALRFHFPRLSRAARSSSHSGCARPASCLFMASELVREPTGTPGPYFQPWVLPV